MFEEHIQKPYEQYVSGVGTGVHQEFYGNVQYAVASGGKLRLCDYHICFGYLNGEWVKQGKAPDAIFIQINTEYGKAWSVTEERYHLYFEWLFNHSPYRHCFLSKDYKKAIKDGVVVIDVNADANLVAGACSMVRLIWEGYYEEYRLPSIVQLWEQLVNKGEDPNLAMGFSNSMSGGKNYTYRSFSCGHQAIPINNLQVVKDFYLDNPRGLFGESYKDERGWDGILRLWISPNPTIELDMEMFVTERLVGSEKRINPFNSAKTSLSFSPDQTINGLRDCIRDFKTMVA
jgi:hypothetical protein